MNYRPNNAELKALIRNFGLAITIGAMFFGAFEGGSFYIAVPFAVIGILTAVTGTLEKKND